MTVDPNVPVGAVLAIGSYALAEDIRFEEPPGSGREKIERALRAMADALADTHPGVSTSNGLQELAALADDATPNDTRLLLIELAVPAPFAAF